MKTISLMTWKDKVLTAWNVFIPIRECRKRREGSVQSYTVSHHEIYLIFLRVWTLQGFTVWVVTSN